MKTIRNRINKFYRLYDLSTPEIRKMSRADMHDRDALMTAYEALWLTLEEYDNSPMPLHEHKWLTDLYGDLGDYIECVPDRKGGNKVAFVVGVISTLIFATCLPNDVGFVTIGGMLASLALAIVASASMHE